ncbi:MAG: ATP-dependent Clp protease ATP-binding subunit [Candidatus Pacebacteria bacterium]|nr:ATP-dependent Clp protease ATP-binding subunit [Candidatus Paceibacterota bacterium]MDD2757376.1 ATP-dependent Clp protease ATP-binding subunit [Candidatus Paceibacterota bacterium]MDD3283823.1 ATP-dependent Clp protease ATP-binding subunit [Candidatus Paceibacterota bacterium]MDD3970114.1 ATP-dependent Clp protease ATP-binding subunit [Candidatus Paceibacterota bacterium]
MNNIKQTDIYRAVRLEKFFLLLKFLRNVSVIAILGFIFLFFKDGIGLYIDIAIILFAFILIANNLKSFFENYLKKVKNKKPLEIALEDGDDLLHYLNFNSVKYITSSKALDQTSILKAFLKPKNQKIRFIMIRLLIDLEAFKKELESIEYKVRDDSIDIIKEAGKIAVKRNSQVIKEGDIIASLAKTEPHLKEIITHSDIEESDFEKVNEWQERISNKLKKMKEWWSYENLLRIESLGSDWTAGYTPTLDNYSIDWTSIVKRRGFEDVVGHEDKVSQLERIISKKNAGNALIIGDAGVGKKNIIHGLIRKSIINRSAKEINGNRFVELDIVSLSASVTSFEQMEKILDQCFKEVVHARNVILIINDFHDFLGGKTKAGIVDVSGLIGNYLHSPYFKTICLTSYSGLHKYIEKKPSILAEFQKIEVEEMSKDDTIKVLEKKVFGVEADNKKFIPFNSLKEIVEICEKYIFDFPFPQKAINILEETALLKDSKVVMPEDVHSLVSEKTQVPIGKIKSQEKEVLLDLESILHKRVVGQEEAIREISSALRRARTGVQTRKGPMGSFLFLGPTGVGKTETAKALAETYFKSEEKIVRLDMSEFQRIEDIERILGSEKQEGILTTQVKENPFSLVLLDEIEKSHPNILNLFLQVLDEGYLNDYTGRKISFNNSIIIATSNAGYKTILKALDEDKEMPEIKKELLADIFEKGLFRPEFINRFDGVVVFKSLNKENLHQIAGLQLDKLNKNLYSKRIKLIITEELKSKIVELSYNPTFGAREMKRIVQDKVENALARELLKDSIPNGSSITIDPKTFKVLIN